MHPRNSRRGAVLIVVMGVLFVLALLATTFASMQSLERQVARNYLDGVRAKLIARSGVDFAYARLTEALNSGQLSNQGFMKSLQYFGQDNNEIGTNPALMNVPLELASNPSMAVESTGSAFGPLESPQNPTNVNFIPKNIYVRTPNGTIPVGFSGIMENATYGLNGDFFSLNVRDASGMIYVNDGITEGTLGSVTKNLRRILNRLGDQLSIANLGVTILTSRPPLGYKTKRELLTVLGATNYAKVAPFVTAHAWVDKNVPNPVPLSGHPTVTSYYNYWYPGETVGNTIFHRGAPPFFRFGVNKNASGTTVPGQLVMAGTAPGTSAPALAPASGLTHAIYGMDQLFPQWIEMTSRAPVNLNAAPREVLIALLADLHGFWVCERRRDNPPSALDGYSGGWNAVSLTYDNSYAPTNQMYSGTNSDGDEYGFLMTSNPVRPTGTGPNSAAWIADELIACRNRAVSPNTGFNYGSATQAPFGGPFRSWRQFDMFVDSLVDMGILADNRAGLYWYHNYPALPNDWTGHGGGPVSSVAWTNNMYWRIGSQAMADAIKANFNPNLHLNEANPDENRNLLIDKTDLIVASTEGTFVPTGYYEIESLGRVVRPSSGTPPDALQSTAVATASDLISEFKVEAVVKLYDALRFTTQRDFYGYGSAAASAPPTGYPTAPNYYTHTVSVVSSLPMTNNMQSIEIGPEPDQGIAPELNKWGGYISWPTNYGELTSPKVPGTLSPLPPNGGLGACNSGIPGCAMHSHFYRNDYLYHNIGADVRNFTKFAAPNEVNACFADPLPPGAAMGPNEPVCGPYVPLTGPDPLSSSPGNRHRLARDFRVPPAAGFGTGTLPAFNMGITAPLDQRIDGIYLERHSTLAYWMTGNLLQSGVARQSGSQMYRITLGYWIKPKFYPEMAGRIRQYWNWSKIDPRGDIQQQWVLAQSGNPFPMSHFYVPSQRPDFESVPLLQPTGPYTSNTYKAWDDPNVPTNTSPWGPGDGSFARYCPHRPNSMCFLNWDSFLTVANQPGPSCCFSGVNNCTTTPTLNHHLHEPAGAVPSIGYPNVAAPALGNTGCLTNMPKRRMNSATLPTAWQRQQFYLLRNPLASGRWIHWHYFWRGGYTMDGGTFVSGIYYAQANGNPYRRLFVNGVGHHNSSTAYSATTPTHDHAYSNAPYFNSASFPCPEFDQSYHHMGLGNCGCTFGPDVHATCPNVQANSLQSIHTTIRNIIRFGENDVWGDTSIPLTDPGATGFGWGGAGGGTPALVQGYPPATKVFGPDSTIDEYYMLSSTAAQPTTVQDGQSNAIRGMFNQGRYHLPLGSGEGIYESPRFNLVTGSSLRALPPPSAVTAPTGYTPVIPPALPPGGVGGAKLIGLAFSWAAESVDPATPGLDPVLTDYLSQTTALPNLIRPRAGVSLYVDSGAGPVWTPYYYNEWFSPVTTATGAPMPVTNATNGTLRFRVQLGLQTGTGTGSGSILAAPFVDDITLYFDGGDAGFVDYHMS